MTAARLILDDGTSFPGQDRGFSQSVSGEVVFNTGMVGYTEALTDPSYAGQILCLTYPLVGNYGVPPHFESARIQVSGLLVSELAHEYSHASAEKSLPHWLRDEGIPCLAGIDTRALTKRLRQHGCMHGRIVVDKDTVDCAAGDRPGIGIAQRVVYPGGGRTVLVVDCGVKESIIDELRARDLTVIRVPGDQDFLAEKFDAVMISNGPGDPDSYHATIRNVARAMRLERPIMGICLGHQILALAAGASTYKLKFGHRGHNQPCVEIGTGRCFITSQNHGYAVEPASLPPGWEPWFINANDGSNEGMRHSRQPFMSVQFHPEAAPGPVDCRSLFDQFVALIR